MRWRDRLTTIGCGIPIVVILLLLWTFFALGVLGHVMEFVRTI